MSAVPHPTHSAIALLQTSSLTSVVQQELERAILVGEYPPGSKLIEAALALKLGVSRGPVREAFRMLEEGQSNAQIVDFLVLRYGDFVLYKPPVNARTYLLWYGPFALLGLGVLGLGGLVLRRRKGAKGSVQATLSVNERERLSALLQQNSQDSK